MTAEVHGPVDFVLLEFSGDRLTGRAAQEVVALVDRGIIALYDVSVVGRTAEGEVYALDLAESAARLGDFEGLAWARPGCSPRTTWPRRQGAEARDAGGPAGVREHLGDPVRGRRPGGRREWSGARSRRRT